MLMILIDLMSPNSEEFVEFTVSNFDEFLQACVYGQE
jgi:hypothetical protein